MITQLRKWEGSLISLTRIPASSQLYRHIFSEIVRHSKLKLKDTFIFVLLMLKDIQLFIIMRSKTKRSILCSDCMTPITMLLRTAWAHDADSVLLWWFGKNQMSLVKSNSTRKAFNQNLPLTLTQSSALYCNCIFPFSLLSSWETTLQLLKSLISTKLHHILSVTRKIAHCTSLAATWLQGFVFNNQKIPKLIRDWRYMLTYLATWPLRHHIYTY